MSKDDIKLDKKKVTETTTKGGRPTKPKRPKRDLRALLRNKGRLFVHESHKDDGYHYGWVTDRHGKVDDYLEIGYEFVEGKDGKPRSKIVTSMRDAGDVGVTGFLMKVDKELYKEIQAIKEEKNIANDVALGAQSGLTNEISHEESIQDNPY